MITALLRMFPALLQPPKKPELRDEESAKEESDSESERSSRPEYGFVVFEWWPSFLPPQRLVMQRVK